MRIASLFWLRFKIDHYRKYESTECAIVVGRWVGRQTRFLVKRGMNSMKTGQFILNSKIYAQWVPPWIHTYFLFRAKCWLQGGVGGQFPKNLKWSHYFKHCKQHKWALKTSSADKFSRTTSFQSSSCFSIFAILCIFCVMFYFLFTFWTVIFMFNSFWWQFFDTAPLNTGSFNLSECWVGRC